MIKKLLMYGIFQRQDEVFFYLTLGYITFLVILFLIFSSIYFISLIRRWLHLRTNVKYVKEQIKKVGDLDEARKQIQFKILRKVNWARDHYHNFRVTWEDARLRGENKAASPIRLKEFLTPEIVIDDIVNRRIAEALPGFFVALGIFGTFLGLVLGLEGLNIDEVKNLKQGVGQLISGLSLAFLTSLAGILLSIIFSFFYRILLRRLEKALLALDGLVSQLFPYYTNEHYIRKHIELQGDVKQSIQTLATDVATQITGTIAPAIDEALTRHLIPTLKDLQTKIKNSIEESKQQQLGILGGFREQVDKMSSAMTNHFENSQEKQAEAMEGVLSQYVEQMNKAFKVQFNDMGRIIEETTKAQSEIKENMVQFTEQLQKQFQVQGDLIDKTISVSQVLSNSLESLENISYGLKSSADDITSAASLLNESATKAMEGQEILKESMERQIHTMRITREELEQAWKTIIENTGSTVELIREVIRELSEGVGNQLINALNTFDGAVAEVVERFSGTLFETNQTIEELPAIMANIDETFKSIQTDVSIQKDILNELKNTTRNIVAPNIEKASEASQDLNKTSEKITKTTKDLEKWFEEILGKLQSSGVAFENKTDNSFNDLKNWSDGFFEKVNQNLKMFEKEGPLYSTLINLNENMIKIYQQPKMTNDAMIDAISNLNNNLKSINESTHKIVRNFDEFRETAASNETKGGFFRRMIKK